MKITIKAARVNANIKLKDAADALGVALSTLIRWEKEETFPDAITLQRMCKLYGCQIGDIFIPETLRETEHGGTGGGSKEKVTESEGS